MRLAMLCIGLMCTLYCMGYMVGSTTPGMAILPGYEHAFTMCVEEGNDDLLVYDADELVIKAYPQYTLYVNKGHEHDPELINLRTLAVMECN